MFQDAYIAEKLTSQRDPRAERNARLVHEGRIARNPRRPAELYQLPPRRGRLARLIPLWRS